ncbi:hypothetical protein GGF46_002538 [Coemansia sp. RSA 552]|nr:hypothetical protein GGF46_002538 [Coemansia sp. RSA 552]
MKPVISSLDQARRARAVQHGINDRVRRVGRFVESKLAQKRQASESPLIVGINGPQGSGKTTMVRGLASYLRARSIKTVGFSLDDIYLTNSQQLALAETHRDNPLLKYRGQPGTHDVELGRSTLLSLLAGSPTDIPAFDKGLNAGYGDRVPKSQWTRVDAPVDVVLFEGWCLGFRALDAAQFARFIADVRSSSDARYKYSRGYSDASLGQVNANLNRYERALYPLVDAWVQMRVADLDVVYRWRKEQEDELAASGRPSLSDQDLEDFVSRFMPGYEMGLPGLDARGFVSSGRVPEPRALRLHLDVDRHVVGCDHRL